MAISDLEMADLVREVCYDEGTGPLMLGGPPAGFRAFADVAGPDTRFPYAILGVDQRGEWETGTGRIDALGRLERMPGASSAGGGAVDFSAGEKQVLLTPDARWFAAVDAHGHAIGEIEGLASAIAGRQAASGELAAIAALPTTAFGRGGLIQANAAAFRSYIGAGTVATRDIGQSGAAVPLLDAVNIWSAAQSFTSPIIARGGINYGTFADPVESAAVNIVSDGACNLVMRRCSPNANPPGIVLTKGRGSVAAPGVVNPSDNIFELRGQAHTGVSFTDVGGFYIKMYGGIPGPANMGSEIEFRAVSVGETVMRSIVRINSALGLAPSFDNQLTLGGGANRWSQVYAGTGTIHTSDEREKRDIQDIADQLLDAWAGVEWQAFRFNDAYAEKGEGARWHFGAIAQQVRDAIDSAMGEGAAVRLGLVCHDAWDAVPAERDVEGNDIFPARGAGDRWGLRYEECFAVEAAWQRRRMDRIEAMIAGGGDVAG